MENLNNCRVDEITLKRMYEYCKKNNENPDDFINECINYRIDTLEELEYESTL